MIRIDHDVGHVSFIDGEHQSGVADDLAHDRQDDVVALTLLGQIDLGIEHRRRPGLAMYGGLDRHHVLHVTFAHHFNHRSGHADSLVDQLISASGLRRYDAATSSAATHFSTRASLSAIATSAEADGKAVSAISQR